MEPLGGLQERLVEEAGAATAVQEEMVLKQEIQILRVVPTRKASFLRNHFCHFDNPRKMSPSTCFIFLPDRPFHVHICKTALSPKKMPQLLKSSIGALN